MPIVIDQFDIQPMQPASPSPGGAEARGGDAPAPSPQQQQAQLTRLLIIQHERRARLRAD
jgi:hypothetical protein